MKNKIRYIWAVLLFSSLTGMMSSCSDEPDTSNYYTFTGEMISEYLKSRSEFSDFTRIVERAGMMDLLSAYGSYTCFPPTNEAVAAYLKKHGKNSIEDLSDADCDTIARTHLVNNMYATSEMNDGVLTTANMNRRYIEISHELDADSNAVVFLNRSAHIIFTMQDDSVENGIMQPINEVLESSNSMLPDIMKQNPKISLFNSALIATGIADSMYKFRDETFNSKDWPRIRYVSHVNKETATVPDEKRYGFTAFVPTDSVFLEKYGIKTLEDMYKKACEIYDAVYPEDVNQPYHAFDQLTHRKNPLNRFIAYHVLTRDVKGWNYLTPLNDIGIITTLMNPVDWYETLLPHTMLKFERLTVRKYAGTSIVGQRYVNRRYDDDYQITGAKVERSIEKEYDCYEGDEMNLFGNFDITFRLPPVPYEGEWQVRMGYAQEPSRGIAQVYFDGKPQGIPLDMTIGLSDPTILGSDWVADYTTLSEIDQAADQKVLKNKGYYRGAAGGYRYNGAGGTTTAVFATQPQTFRIVFCTVHMDPNQDHYLRIRCVSSKKGNDNEFMLDYLELVPKSIYGVTDEGQMEDML